MNGGFPDADVGFERATVGNVAVPSSVFGTSVRKHGMGGCIFRTFETDMAGADSDTRAAPPTGLLLMCGVLLLPKP